MILRSRYGGCSGPDSFGGFDGPDGFAELHKNRLLVYQEPVLIAISGFGTQELLAVLPSQSDAKTTQGQSCSSND